MKRSLFLLASLVLSSALYAQAENPLFTREQVLDIFAQYNPSALERAKQDSHYQALLDGFIQTFRVPDNLENRFEVIAAARNFDNSIRLHALTERYVEQATWARMSGQKSAGIEAAYKQDVQDVMTDIFAVTLQANNWKLHEMRQALKQLKKEASSAQQQEQIANAKAAIKQQKSNIRLLKKNAGEMVVSYCGQQLAQANEQVTDNLTSAKRASAQESSAKQASNLQIKTNHKKPVAK